MIPNRTFRDSLHRLAQLGQATGVQMVCIKEAGASNRYTAEPVEFNEDGETQSAGAADITVVNLAEPADEDGQLPIGTNAVAIDVEGEWVVLVQAEARQVFAARILYTFGDGLYRVRPQTPVGENTFEDKTGASDINACNVAELNIEETDGVLADTIVIVTALVTDSNPPTIRYAFDHPVEEEYL